MIHWFSVSRSKPQRQGRAAQVRALQRRHIDLGGRIGRQQRADQRLGIVLRRIVVDQRAHDQPGLAIAAEDQLRAAMLPGCPWHGQGADDGRADLQRKVRDAALGLSQPGQRLLRRACVPGRWRHGFAGLGLAHPALQRMALRKAVAAVQAHGALVLCEDLQLDRTQAGSLAALHEVLQQRRAALPRDSGTAPIVARRQRAMPGRGATSAKASTAPLAASTAARPSARSAPGAAESPAIAPAPA
jgi:hypothetical protein